MNDKDKKKLIFVYISFLFFFVLILGKAFKIQVLDKEELMARSKEQIFRESKVYPKRGNIYDRDGNPLAINIQTYSIFILPKNLKKGSDSIERMAKIIPEINYSQISKKVKRRNKFTWVARKMQLSKEQVEKLRDLPGIYIESVPKRFYPNHELLSQALGFVGIDNVGLSGIEYRFDEELRGAPRLLRYIIDNKGRPVKFESSQAGNDAKDIYLTIDKELQAIAEKSLKDAVVEYNALKGGVGVIDATTGEILAIANYPSFDPNEPSDFRPESRKLSFVSDPIEPGSIFKIFTVASALEHKIARPDTNYYCEEGRLKVEDHIITEAESKKKYEWMSVSDIIKYSSNVGTTKIAFDLTFPKLKSSLKKFGVGVKTDVELPGESRGILAPEENVSPLSLSNISFGQGVATTGIQMLAAYAAIANGGTYFQPTIIKKDKAERKGKRILDEKIANELTEMLVSAVEDGTGTNAKIPYFKVAGKTSTAQRPDQNGSYSGYIPGFIGFPVNIKNKFVIYAYVEDPKGNVYYGNNVAAPIFKKIAQFILYKNKELGTLADVSDDSKRYEFDTVSTRQFAKRSLGPGKVPNFQGLDKRSSRNLANQFNISLKHHGIGIVHSQSVEAGSKLEEGQSIDLHYMPPKYE